jgi:integrase
VIPTLVTALALKLAPLVFVRPGELRAAEWARAPGDRDFARARTIGEGRALPVSSLRTRDRSMSENTINAALQRLGYSSEEQTGHGFRSMASTLLNEQGYPPDVIEMQPAHTERNKMRAAYNKAQRLPERRKMMQAWADYLDWLRASAIVSPINDG